MMMMMMMMMIVMMMVMVMMMMMIRIQPFEKDLIISMVTTDKNNSPTEVLKYSQVHVRNASLN
jgi:hypothetical protein